VYVPTELVKNSSLWLLGIAVLQETWDWTDCRHVHSADVRVRWKGRYHWHWEGWWQCLNDVWQNYIFFSFICVIITTGEWAKSSHAYVLLLSKIILTCVRLLFIAIIILTFFTTWHYASPVYVMAVSVCLSVTSPSSAVDRTANVGSHKQSCMTA